MPPLGRMSMVTSVVTQSHSVTQSHRAAGLESGLTSDLSHSLQLSELTESGGAPSHSRQRCRVLGSAVSTNQSGCYKVYLYCQYCVPPPHWSSSYLAPKLVYFPEVSTWLTAMISLMFIVAHAGAISTLDNFPLMSCNLSSL